MSDSSQSADAAKTSIVEDLKSDHYALGLPCPKCSMVNPSDSDLFKRYFDSGMVACCGCEASFDLWREATADWKQDFPSSWMAFQLVECIKTSFRVRLDPEKRVTVELSSYGVPPDAEVLDVKIGLLGPSDGQPVFPALMLLGVDGLSLDPIPRLFGLYGATFGTPPGGESHAMVGVTWIQPGPDEVSLHHLADAAKRYAAGRYAAMVVSANIAVEAALTPAMEAWFELTYSRDDTDRLFGKDGISYARQITLTKMASKALGLADMPGQIRNLLHDLRDQRNGIVHEGTFRRTKQPVDKNRAAEFLAASAFGYQYARYLYDAIRKRRPSKDSK